MSCLPIRTPTAPAANATVAIAMAEPAASCHLVAGGRGAVRSLVVVVERCGSRVDGGRIGPTWCSTTSILAAHGRCEERPRPPPLLAHCGRSSKATSSLPPRSSCLHSSFTPLLQPRHGVAVPFAIERFDPADLITTRRRIC